MTERAICALEDVVAIEDVAPGMVKVVSWADSYVVDARDGMCQCPDQQFNLDDASHCKHEWAAILANSDRPAPWDIEDNLDQGPEPLPDFRKFDPERQYV